MSGSTIVVAGATGNLGGRIAKVLRERGAVVRALVRREAAPEKVEGLRAIGVTIAVVDLGDAVQVAAVCSGATCVVSALNGLRDVIVDTQSVLLGAAVRAGVPRFIPSDYSIDLTKLAPGSNRNLDLRREFHRRLEAAPIAATTIYNGAFMELLTAQMPMILFKRRRILYWGNADQRLDFTTVADTAVFTAMAALDPKTPRFLRVAGDRVTARQLAALMTELTGTPFRLFRPGGLGMLGAIIRVARLVAPAKNDVFPAWQGMQYMHNMFDGRAVLEPLDNDRYPGMRWTTVRDLLAKHLAA